MRSVNVVLLLAGGGVVLSGCNSIVGGGGAGQPVSTTPGQIVVREVKQGGLLHPGSTVGTDCFSVTAPVETYAAEGGCRMQLSPAPTGQFTTPDAPYFEIENLTDTPQTANLSLEAKAQTMLDAIAAKMAQQPPLRTAQKGVSGGKYDTVQGAYRGMKDVTVGGQPAKEMVWGFTNSGPNINNCVVDASGKTTCSHTITSESVAILVNSPSGHIVWAGKPANTVYIRGHLQGYHSAAFSAALASTVLR